MSKRIGGLSELKLSIIIPVYNEAQTIQETLTRIKGVSIDKEIIVVDDFSSDGTREILKKASDIKLILHEKNQGKGMAIRTALEHVTGDVVIIQDADLEYDPDDYPIMIEPIASGEAEVVYGSRFLYAKPHMRLANYLANKLLAFVASILFGVRVTDEATCYKAFRADLLKKIHLTCRRFEFCPEVTAKILRQGIKIKEVPIHYEARTLAQGKKIGWMDGLEALWTLVKFRFVK